jgi:hypothetical protein
MQESIDDPKENQLSMPMEMVQWWEKKRYIYNAILILSTTFTLYTMWDYTGNILTKKEAVMHGIWLIILCNIYYTLAWVGGILHHHYLQGYPLSVTSRWVLFSLGSLFSILVIEFDFTIALDVLFAN